MVTSATEFALGGYSPAAQAEVVASHQVGEYAAVYVKVGGVSGYGADVAVLRRVDQSWQELSSASPGGLWWVAEPVEADDDEVDRCLGLLVACGDEAAAGVVEVSLDGRLVTAPVMLGHWIALFVGVYDDAMSRVSITEPRSGR